MVDVDRVRLELDVAAFDAARFAAYVTRCRAEGIRLTTPAVLGATPEHRRALYELNGECSADIPERGEFFSFEEYVERRFAVASYAPGGVVIALDGDRWIGMAATSVHDGFLFNEMTGVRRDYRGRGVATAMKTFAMGFARERGARRITTLHHPANTGVIVMNQRLGFTESPDGAGPAGAGRRPGRRGRTPPAHAGAGRARPAGRAGRTPFGGRRPGAPGTCLRSPVVRRAGRAHAPAGPGRPPYGP
ncbi:GNAT family N-acetyltransferase [Streptomyces sp. LP05-1]|uniref:GNAT family N-acetyltransferase n=1 Tax=Streptomyces pyxinae TaxID=2970734 RepID=A0ABT2CM16_9ACTN|nr:GNAT family N-acetyltransferase [Streptomyces sp. LP05-1]MCS0638452.1 GNAT family N-acetyltransferase [Streptomyces sp. LP05-1]